jgi:hypothetical protein
VGTGARTKEKEAAMSTIGGQQQIEEVRRAIREGRAYLKTFAGVRNVTAYNDATGWAMTSNGAWMDQRSFVVILDDIKITPEAQQ